MSEIEIIWKEFPPKVTRSKWADMLAPLQERPGDWAMVRTDTPEKIGGLRTRLAKTATVKDRFELRTHRVSEQVAELCVRYAPPESLRQ